MKFLPLFHCYITNILSYGKHSDFKTNCEKKIINKKKTINIMCF